MPTNAPSAASVSQASEYFAKGFAALGIPVTPKSIGELIVGLYLGAKFLRNYVLKRAKFAQQGPVESVLRHCSLGGFKREPVAPGKNLTGNQST